MVRFEKSRKNQGMCFRKFGGRPGLGYQGWIFVICEGIVFGIRTADKLSFREVFKLSQKINALRCLFFPLGLFSKSQKITSESQNFRMTLVYTDVFYEYSWTQPPILSSFDVAPRKPVEVWKPEFHVCQKLCWTGDRVQKKSEMNKRCPLRFQFMSYFDIFNFLYRPLNKDPLRLHLIVSSWRLDSPNVGSNSPLQTLCRGTYNSTNMGNSSKSGHIVGFSVHGQFTRLKEGEIVLLSVHISSSATFLHTYDESLISTSGVAIS